MLDQPFYITCPNTHIDTHTHTRSNTHTHTLKHTHTHIRTLSNTHTQPLFYAASIGNTRLIHVLLEANANTDITCNQGETPANIAYANGHNSIVDLLEGMTSSPRRPDGGSGLTGGGVQGEDDNTPK